MQIPWPELVAVAVVGLGLAWAGKKIPVLRHPLVLGTALYTAGYVVSQQRPKGGWSVPGMPAALLTGKEA